MKLCVLIKSIFFWWSFSGILLTLFTWGISATVFPTSYVSAGSCRLVSLTIYRSQPTVFLIIECNGGPILKPFYPFLQKMGGSNQIRRGGRSGGFCWVLHVFSFAYAFHSYTHILLNTQLPLQVVLDLLIYLNVSEVSHHNQVCTKLIYTIWWEMDLEMELQVQYRYIVYTW